MRQTKRRGPEKLRVSMILFLALTTASCATAGRHEKNLRQALNVSVEAFNTAIKWQDYQHAVVFVPKDKEERFWSEMDRFKREIRLTDYQVRDAQLVDQGAFAKVIVHFQYWRLESPILRSVTFTQRWYFNKTEKLWRVSDSGLEAITGTPVGF